MRHKMSKEAVRELLAVIRGEYRSAGWKEKGVLLDTCVAATGYSRKYLTKLLRTDWAEDSGAGRRKRRRRYDEGVKEALKLVWLASNRLCSKRLVPFLPTLMVSMQRFGHLPISGDVKEKLLSLSPATVDRLLREERKRYGRSKSTTKPGRLLKRHIPVRTFADWNEAEPGFLEADTVAHCGETAKGAYLSTLTLTDIVTGWTELVGLPNKTESAVVSALARVSELLPFPVKGLDTDNGSEFINSAVVDWCCRGSVTFTRSREYKKNDQAHVEEKNGSVVRRLVGYDRFEGEDSLEKLQALYAVARLFVNYFQPSMKLCSKQRDGARVTRAYDRAQTPCERLLQSRVGDAVKRRIRRDFKSLDPVKLLSQIEKLQLELWKTATVPDPRLLAADSLAQTLMDATGSDAQTLVTQLDEHRRLLRKRRGRAKTTRSAPVPSAASVPDGIRKYVQTLQPGRSFKVSDVLALGPRTAVDKALSRLTKEHVIVRTGWGRYVRPLAAQIAHPPPLKTAANE